MPRKRKQATDPAAGSAPTLAMLREERYALADPADAIHLQRFFKTAPGEYGAGDKFLGLRVPALRRLVREYNQLADAHALEMLASSWHEERLLALLLLVDGYRRGDSSRRDKIHRAYLAHTRYINNWDLVDASAEHIVGPHLNAQELELLERLEDAFLKKHYREMPRTMLRYAIERHPERVRKQYLAGAL